MVPTTLADSTCAWTARGRASTEKSARKQRCLRIGLLLGEAVRRKHRNSICVYGVNYEIETSTFREEFNGGYADSKSLRIKLLRLLVAPVYKGKAIGAGF